MRLAEHQEDTENIGDQIYSFASEIFPIPRSLTGDGVRKTLKRIQEDLPDLTIHEIPSGTKVFDWEVPDEWNIRDAYILDPENNKIADFKKNNIHVLGYSIPIEATLSLSELEEHLYSLPELPEAIPYVTSYYKKRWGFCLKHSERTRLRPGDYKVHIDSTLEPGSMTYGELLIPSTTGNKQEILLSANICHPSLANNEISGPSVTVFLSKWLLSLKERTHSYRIIFIPETVGSIAYIHKNLEILKERTIAGFVVCCVGDEQVYSFVPTRNENTLSDQVALHCLSHLTDSFINYPFLERGSDERQYNSPGIDLPVASILRSKYLEYKEYHTSLDDMSFITPKGLFGGYNVIKHCLFCIEKNVTLQTQVLCEPFLSKRGLYPTLGQIDNHEKTQDLMNVLAYSDGSLDLLSIADKLGRPLWALIPIVDELIEKKLLKPIALNVG